jgi:hypothetical protein
VGEPEYEGIPIRKVRIEAIEWPPEAEDHIRNRAQRKGRPNEFNVEPVWATEAALEFSRIVDIAGESIVVVGRSWSAPPREKGDSGRILKVFLRPKDLEQGIWEGRTACDASDSDRRQYKELNK